MIGFKEFITEDDQFYSDLKYKYNTKISIQEFYQVKLLINESSVTDLKSKILNLISSINHIEELQPIFNMLYKTKIETSVEEFLNTKGIGTRKNISWLTDKILFGSNADIQEKIDFVNNLMDSKNLIPYSLILKSDIIKADKIAKVMNSQVFQDIKQSVMDWKTVDGFGSAEVGKGEAYFILFGDKITKGKSGDLDVNGKEIEIKGAGGRPRGQKGYNSPVGALQFMLSKFPNFNPKTDTFAGSKLKNLSKVLSDSSYTDKELYTIMTHAFSLMYNNTSIYKPMAKKWMSKILNGRVLSDDAHHYLTALQLDYYKTVEGYYSTMFVNPVTFNAINIKDGEVYIKNKTKFKISSFTWNGNESRNSVNAITYNI
tara:strand:- start:2 stop:1117 length:1116 start_codon:yes stop_codon:yes gene_type:complete